jgi:hypothetical protein
LEEIDFLFATPEIRDSALAARVVHDRHAETVLKKDQIIEYEEKEDV